MKKIILSLGAIIPLSALLMMTSCKKEENSTNQFVGTIEQFSDKQGKTIFNGEGEGNYSLHWTTTDQVQVYDQTTNATFNVTPDANDATIGHFSGNTLLENAPYTAIYPASIASSSNTVSLPIEQTCDANGFPTSYPMYAPQTNEQRLAFKNLCGLLKLNLQGDGITLKTIYFIGNTAVNGTFTIGQGTDGNPTLTSANNANGKAITLNLPEGGINISTAKDFYLSLPKGNYSNFTLTFLTTDGRYWTKTTKPSAEVVIERSQYSTINIQDIDNDLLAQGALPGLIPSASDATVRFSKGNLQYFKNGTSTEGTYWRFAEHQYDYVGGTLSTYVYGTEYYNGMRCTNLGINDDNYVGFLDLFSWSDNNNYYGITNSSNSDDYNANNFVDWGTNAIVNGGNQVNLWHTPTASEFDYIFGRNNSTRIYALIYSDYSLDNLLAYGIYILPDNFKNPFGSHNNKYNIVELEQMEAAGAVFLPFGGHRFGSSYYLGASNSYPYPCAYYRSNQMNNVQYMFSANRSNSSMSNGGPCGASVRLVLGAPSTSSK